MIPKATARAFAKALLDEHASGVSYERIAERYPCDGQGRRVVKRGTLGRIAKSEGAYMPKDKTILAALGLLAEKPEPPEWLVRRKKAIRKMVKDTRKALQHET